MFVSVSSGCLRPDALTLCLILVILFGQAFKVSTECSVTLTIRGNPLPGIDIGYWNDANISEGWNLNAIRLEVVNYDRYRNFKL
ncbi:MAG: hypothetical protein K2M31_03285 [Muribaculaceae bacterium]|nr:hypothetical protein [Muribaculaceae bacterium]